MGSPQQFILGFEMKWTLCLLFVASVATAFPREKKSFGLFSVVTFPNDICTTTMTPAMSGICITAEECTNSGDIVATASGNCASGFGVCCARSISTEGGSITQDVVHIQNSNYPSFETALQATAPAPSAATRAFNIMGGANICQIRLDFIDVEVSAGTTGDCATDQISVNTPDRSAVNTGLGNLCGVLTDQHVYVDVSTAASAMSATVNVNTGAASGDRKWKIMVQRVECGDADLSAPTGCAQLYTATSGRIKSFNFGATRSMLISQLYTICVRPASGMTGMTLREAGTTADAFQVGVGPGSCDDDRLMIPNAGSGPAVAGGVSNLFCGSVLASANGATQAGTVQATGFKIGVFSDATANAAGTGFDLIYTQT